MHAIEAVSAEICRQAATVIPEPPVCADKAILVERNVRRRAKKKVPISARWRFRIGHTPEAVWIHVHIVPDAHEMNGTQLAILNDAGCFGIMRS